MGSFNFPEDSQQFPVLALLTATKSFCLSFSSAFYENRVHRLYKFVCLIRSSLWIGAIKDCLAYKEYLLQLSLLFSMNNHSREVSLERTGALHCTWKNKCLSSRMCFCRSLGRKGDSENRADARALFYLFIARTYPYSYTVCGCVLERVFMQCLRASTGLILLRVGR